MRYFAQIDSVSNKVFSIIQSDNDTSDSPHIVELGDYDIAKLGQIYDSTTKEFYSETDETRLTFGEYKESKKNYLIQLADTELTSGFTSDAMGFACTFSYDKLSQERLGKQGIDLALNPDLSLIDWKTADKGFITATREQFLQILRDAASHEKTISFKLLYAQAHIDNAQNKDEVDAIVASW